MINTIVKCGRYCGLIALFAIGCISSVAFGANNSTNDRISLVADGVNAHLDPNPFSGFYVPASWTLTNSNANGSVNTSGAPANIILTGGNNGSGSPGTTSYTHLAIDTGVVSFDWSYSSVDDPTFDFAGYLLNGVFTQVANTNGQSGSVSFNVSKNDVFGFRVGTTDNLTGPGVFTISNFSAPVPEPSTTILLLPAIGLFFLGKGRSRRLFRGAIATLIVGAFALIHSSAFAQRVQRVTTQRLASAAPRVVDVSALARTPAPAGQTTADSDLDGSHEPLPPPLGPRASGRSQPKGTLARFAAQSSNAPLALPNFVGFTGLTHLDQRLADNGNQFSIEPPDQALAVGNNKVVEAVNLGFNVYNLNGVALLPRTLSINEFFGLGHAINRANGNVQGPSLTDPVALYDAGSNRFFLCIGAQTVTNNVKAQQSQIYLAVSQTSDPTGLWNIYTIDTTNANAADGLGPRFADYEHMATDANGVYLSANEYQIRTNGSLGSFRSAAIYCLRKSAVVAGGVTPPITRIQVPYSCDLNTGVCQDPDNSAFEFTIFPVVVSPDSSYFTGNNGTQFFVSSDSDNDVGSFMAVWALTNTASLNTASPSLTLTKAKVDTQDYSFPVNLYFSGCTQKEGFRPLGLELTNPGLPNTYSNPPAALPKINSGDDRVQNATYAVGRIWATLSSEVMDSNNQPVIGAAYFCFAPSFRSGFTVTVLSQGTLMVDSTNLLRSAIVSNKNNQGAMVFTLQGLNNYPSSAFVPINDLTPGGIVIARDGNVPEDGFTGYPAVGGGNGIARWGDYSAACVNQDSSIFMATMYTQDINRTINANWDTYVTHYTP